MRAIRIAVVAAVLGLLGLLVWDVAHGNGPGVARRPRPRHPARPADVGFVVAVAVALVLAAPAAACATHASQGSLETQLVCPSCHTTLDESDSEVAREMKAEIARRIAACQSE